MGSGDVRIFQFGAFDKAAISTAGPRRRGHDFSYSVRIVKPVSQIETAELSRSDRAV